MANPTKITRKTVINHLPSASPDWADRYLAGLPVKPEPWQGERETRQRLVELGCRYQRLPDSHDLYSRLAVAEPPPIDLWCAGQLPPPPYLVVVGPRQPSESARQLTRQIVSWIAPQITIVSGLASGIDSLALETALAVGGRVIAIPPLGLHDVMSRPDRLTDSILNRGALLAERLFVTRLSKSHFLWRNRLLAALADAVYAPAAGDRSGTINTLNLALRLGVDLFVSPGDTMLASTAGTNRLIRDGANVVLTPNDLAQGLGLQLQTAADDWLEEALRRGALTAGQMAEKSGRTLSDTLCELTAAQAAGRVEQDQLGRFRLLAGGVNS